MQSKSKNSNYSFFPIRLMLAKSYFHSAAVLTLDKMVMVIVRPARGMSKIKKGER
jgi:hypothetical protein